MLEGTGITTDEEQAYRLLVRAGEACAQDLAAQLRLSGDGVRAADAPHSGRRCGGPQMPTARSQLAASPPRAWRMAE